MGADFPGDDCVIPTLRINFPPLSPKSAYPSVKLPIHRLKAWGHSRWTALDGCKFTVELCARAGWKVIEGSNKDAQSRTSVLEPSTCFPS